MPTDTTYIHAIDVIAAQGPMWLFVAGILVLLAFITVKAMPLIRDHIQQDSDIKMHYEKRKAEEMRLRDERDREHSQNSVLMVDAMNRQSDSNKAMAAAIELIVARIDDSKNRSQKMGETIDTDHETIEKIAGQVDEIHAVTVLRVK